MDNRIRENYVELSMDGMLEQVALYHNGGLDGAPTNSYALGYTLYTYLENINDAVGVSSDSLKKLSFNGIKPTSESIENGSYPLSDAYYAVVRSDLLKKNTAWSILSWLKTDKGINAIEDLGYISLIK